MNNIKDVLNKFIKGEDRKIPVIIAIGLIGILLLGLSGINDGGSSKKAEKQSAVSDNSEYAKELEDKLCSVISSIDGVGKCKVMITLEATKESVYAVDSESRNDNSSNTSKEEYVFSDYGSSEEPVLIKEKYPKVQGVTVVCSGGDNSAVRQQIVNCVTALFDINANRVSVSKIK